MPHGPVPTMRDVADRAGVSYQTVSRVLNDSPRLRPETRDRVLRAIADLDYSPNQHARALVTSRTRTIGVLAALSDHHGPAVTVAAVAEAARAAGYRVTITTPDPSDPAALRSGLSYLLQQRVEALVVLTPQDEVIAAISALPGSVPVIALAADPSPLSVDQRGGARLAVRHLLGLGHRRIAHVAGPLDWAEARMRVEGWRAELADAGGEVLEPVQGDWTARSGDAALPGVVALGATAVFAANDQMALGLMSAAQREGIRIPAELSVIGFDDIAEAPYLVPPLTTVRQDLAELGRRAVQVLVSQLHGEDPDLAVIPPELIVRASTAPPANGSTG